MPAVVKPKALQKGDTIAIIAPSEPILKVKDLEKTKLCLEKLGYHVETSENILAAVGDYVAGTSKERASDFNRAFSNPDVKAVFVALGGMGASQILEHIDFDTVKKNPKIFAGYSDATTLELAILAKTGLISFHGPNAMSLPDFNQTGYTFPSFWKALAATEKGMTIGPQSKWSGLVEGAAEGTLLGGNLSCFCKLLGTPWDPIAAIPKIFGEKEKFLFFWEEANEHFSEVMRNLWQLRNSGFFAKISGMIVGKLTDIAEKDYSQFPNNKVLIKEISEPFGFPILYGVDFGHDVPRATIPIGVKAAMDSQKRNLEILEPLVDA